MAKPIQHGDGWRIRWYGEQRARHSETYPSYKDAEFALERHRTEVKQVRRGLREVAAPVRSFDELCDKYLLNRSSQKRRPGDDEIMVRVHLRPAFGSLILNSINIEHIDRYKLSKRHLQPKTVHHHLTLFITMMNYAKDLGWVTKALKVKKPKIALFDKDFRYLRTKDEIDTFLRSAWDEGELVHALYSTAVFTGLREGELAGLKRSDIDFERRLITVQRSYDGPTKSGEVRHVPILDALLPTLQRWCLRNPFEWVFPSWAGTMQGHSARIFQEVLHRVLDRGKFPMVERYGKLRHYIVFHDLRHTFASHWVMRSGDIFKLQKILGHKSVQMTMRYAHLAPEAFVADYGRFGAETSGTHNVANLGYIHRP